MSSPASVRVPRPRRARRGKPILLSSTGGYFRHGGENEFPWDCRSGAWYYLLTPDGKRLKQTGYNSSLGDKWQLLDALRKAAPGQAHLFGVWTGQWESHVFVLDPRKAIARLEKALGWKPEK